ncbi:PilZ domain-containing protein [Thiolapillus sp.]
MLLFGIGPEHRDATMYACKHNLHRVKTTLRAQLSVRGTNTQPVLIEQISETGLDFLCDAGAQCRIMPEERKMPGPVFGVYVDIVFSLPNANRELRTRCRVLFCHRLSQNSYRFGCEFHQLDDADQALLQEFLQQAEVDPARIFHPVTGK